MMRRTLKVLLAASLLLAACGGGSDTDPSSEETEDEITQSYEGVKAYPVFVSAELVSGPNRFVVGLLDDQDAPLADPEIEMAIDFFPPGEDEPSASEEMRWVWIEEGVRGYYVGNVTFEGAGNWGALIHLRGGGVSEDLRSEVPVAAKSTTPALGSKPPASDTPTLDDVKNVKAISTDTSPDPRFYKYSIAEALDRGEPSVVVFATPKFCQSAVCAPTLDTVQGIADEFPEAAFVHVEPYVLKELPERLVPVESMLEWKLPTEPWVFVMDGQGRVVAKFEGVMAPEELREALTSEA